MEEKKENLVVTPSGRLLDTDNVPPDTNVVVDPDAIPVTYDEANGDEIDPEMLEHYYAMAQHEAMMRQMQQPRRFIPKSVHTKKAHDKAKRNSRNKMAKKSRKKNRKK